MTVSLPPCRLLTVMRRPFSLLLGSLLGITVLLIGATPSWAYPF